MKNQTPHQAPDTTAADAYTKADYYRDLAAENDLPIIEVEQLLEILKRNYEDAEPLTELPPLPFTKGFAEKARENDLGVYVAVGDEQFTSLVKFFLRACKIDGKYYYYTANFC